MKSFLNITKGNIFTTDYQTIVNTVNCVGVMGAGIAYEFRLRYPEMFAAYSRLCKAGKMQIGNLWLFKAEDKWILNFPTKHHWRYESRTEYLEKGLQKFLDTYVEKGIQSIAFPVLGASNGGIPEDVSITIMKEYLSQCNIPVMIYQYDPSAHDDLFIKFKKQWNSLDEEDLAKESQLPISFVRRVSRALEKGDVRSLSQLTNVKGIGNKTLEKSFHFVKKQNLGANRQLKLL